MLPHSDNPALIADLAQSGLEYVKRSVGIDLDFSSETLPILDHYLMDKVRQAVPGQEDELSAEFQELIAPAAGAYFGMVIQKELGDCRWFCPEQDFSHYRIEFEHCFIAFNPMGAALEAMIGRAAPGWHAHFSLRSEDQPLIEEALERSASIHDNDFFRLSVRFDTLQHIESILMGKAAAEGKSDQSFPSETYAKHFAHSE